MSSSRADDILRQILSLTKDERMRLATLTSALVVSADDPTIDAIDESPKDEEASATAWLATIGHQKPWVRFQLIDCAIEDVSTDGAVGVLDEARRTLLEQHPAVSVRAAVTDLAQRQPAAVIFAMLGLVIALVVVAAKFLRLAF